jgi:hypothetical protein
MSFAAYILGVAGFGCLALSWPKHWRDVSRINLPKGLMYILRTAGCVLLLAALAFCVSRWGAAIGAAAWVGTMSVSALSTAILLSYSRALFSIRTT